LVRCTLKERNNLQKKTKILLIILLIFTILFYILFGIIKVQDIIIKTYLYPKKYSEIVSIYSSEYNVDENLVYAIMKAESNFDEKAKSSKGAIGLMQLMYDTAEQVGKSLGIQIDEKLLYDPDVNINIGTKYISTLINKYNGCISLALCAYNAGSGTTDNWISKGIIKDDGSDIENIPYKETNNYVRKILRDYKIYEQ